MTNDFYVDLLAEEGDDFDSSSLDTIGYDRINKTLFVEFQSGYAIYAYSDVEESVYNAFLEADSLGRFYTNYVQPNFTSTKYDYGYLNMRDDIGSEEEPEKPKLTLLVNEEPNVLSISGDGGVHISGRATGPHISITPKLTRWTVNYVLTLEGKEFGPFSPEFEAFSEADALRSFNEAMEKMSNITNKALKAKVKEVIHYFE